MFTVTLVLPLTSPSMIKWSAVEPGPPKKESRIARAVEGDATIKEIFADEARGVGDAERVANAAVLQRNGALVVEALKQLEGAVFGYLGVSGGEHRAALLVGEHVVAQAEIAGELGLEHAALLVGEGIVGICEHDETGNMATVVDGGRGTNDIDGQIAARRDIARIDDRRAGGTDGEDTGVTAVDAAGVDD